jgi:hypothetical protein
VTGWGPTLFGPTGQPLFPTMPGSVQPSMSATQPITPMPFPPGMMPSMSIDPMGMSPNTGSAAVAQQYARAQMKQALDAASQMRMLSGEIERNFRSVRDLVKETTAELTNAAASVSPSGAGSAAPGQAPAAPARPRIAGDRRAPKPVDDPVAAVGAQGGPGSGLPEGVPAGREGFNLRDVGRRAVAMGARQVSERTGQYELVDQPDGTRRWVRSATGDAVGALRARGLGVATQMDKGLGEVAGGAKLTEAFPALGRVAGPVAALASAGYEVGERAEQQRAANLPYQQITGGPNFSLTDPDSGFRQRVSENRFRYSQFGVMGGDEARALYLGVAQTGLRGDDRQSALKFATDQFKRTGMEVADSINLIEQSVRNGVDNFASLDKAISDVSTSARTAGMNVQVQQRAFAATLGQVQTNVTGNATAPVIAAGIQTELQKQGHTLGGQIDFSGMFSQQSMMLQASALGQTPGQYQAAAQDDPSLVGRGLQSQIDRIRDAVFSTQAMQVAAGLAREAMSKSGGQLTSADAANIGRELAERGLLNTQQFMAVAAQLGLGGVTQANVYEVAAKIAVGGIRLDQSLASSSSTLPDSGRTVGGAPVATAGAGASQQQLSLQAKTIADATGGYSTSPDPTDLGLSKEGRAYLEEVQGSYGKRGKVDQQGTGQRSAVVEALLKQQKSFSKDKFVVQTKDGPAAVSFSEAFKTYRDQLERGDVVIQDTGETVSQAVGAPGNRDQRISSNTQAAPKGSTDPSKGAMNGTVTIYPSAELQKILQFRTSGGVYVESAQRSGTPAAAFPATPNDYPSATGTGN